MFSGLEKVYWKRIFDAVWKVLERYNHRQRFLRSQKNKKKKKKVISESYIPDAFGLNKATDFVVPTEEEDKNALDFLNLFQIQMFPMWIWSRKSFGFII